MSALNQRSKDFKPAEPKLAATVLICKELSTPRNGFNYEILFVKRRQQARFMPGYHVFPGGIIEPSDRLSDGHPLLPSPLPSHLKNPLTRTLRFAAAREVFEESNVLLCDPVVSKEKLGDWRKTVLKDCTQFETMCKSLDCKPSWDALYEWSHWITPEEEKYRYDTYFYLIPIEKSRHLDAQIDDFEITSHDWITPGEVLQRYDARQIQLAPPTWILAAELCSYPILSDLIKVAKRGRSMEAVMPKFRVESADSDQGNTIVLCLPGDKDSSHPVNDKFIRRLEIRPGEKYKFVSSLPESDPWQSYSSIVSKL